MSRARFLRVALVNVLYVSALATAAVSYSGTVHPAGKIAAVVVLVVYALASGNCLRVAWREQHPMTVDYAHIDLAIRACPMLALLGSIGGFLVAFSGDAADVQQRVLGASTGLLATFVGVSAALVLMLQRHLLDA